MAPSAEQKAFYTSESLGEMGNKSRTSVGNHVGGDSMVSEDVTDKNIGGFQSCWELRQGNEVSRFREPIDYSEGNSVVMS